MPELMDLGQAQTNGSDVSQPPGKGGKRKHVSCWPGTQGLEANRQSDGDNTSKQNKKANKQDRGNKLKKSGGENTSPSLNTVR